jgi:di/tricarboxylate transporter
MRVIDVLRGDESLRRQFPEVTLAEGDRVVLRTEMQELLGLKDSSKVTLVDRVGSRSTTTVEALIMPDCKLVGRSLGSLRLRRRYGVYPLAVHRRNQNIGRQLDDVVVRVGDTLLLEGAPDDIRRLADDADLLDLSETTDRPYKRGRAPFVLLVLAGIVVCSSLDLAPIQILAMLGVVALLASRTIEPEEAYNTVSASLMILILAMLVVGEALDRSGAAQMLVDAISPTLATLSPLGVLFVLYFMTQILTELLSNNAVAVIVTPVAIALAENLGLDPRALVVAVMFAATLAFATPIGYQTNTMVYGPGGYRFFDFTRIGLPLNIVTGVVACLVIPIFWPLVPA